MRLPLPFGCGSCQYADKPKTQCYCEASSPCLALRGRCQRRVTPAADGRGFSVGSDPQIAPPTCANVRQAGRRGRRPLRSGRTFPRRGGACPSRRPARMSDKRATTRVAPTERTEVPRRGGAKCPLGYAPPADLRPRPTNGRGKPRPYGADGGSPVGEGLSAL
jgi:hypothetical protein